MIIYRIENRQQNGPFNHVNPYEWREHGVPKSSISDRPYAIITKYTEAKYGFESMEHLNNYFSANERNQLNWLGFSLAVITLEPSQYLDTHTKGEDQLVFDNLWRINTEYQELR